MPTSSARSGPPPHPSRSESSRDGKPSYLSQLARRCGLDDALAEPLYDVDAALPLAKGMARALTARRRHLRDDADAAAALAVVAVCRDQPQPLDAIAKAVRREVRVLVRECCDPVVYEHGELPPHYDAPIDDRRLTVADRRRREVESLVHFGGAAAVEFYRLRYTRVGMATWWLTTCARRSGLDVDTARRLEFLLVRLKPDLAAIVKWKQQRRRRFKRRRRRRAANATTRATR